MENPKIALITGAAGFLGHHLVDHLLLNTNWKLILLDRLDCSGTLARFQESRIFHEHKTRCRWIWHDLKAPINEHVENTIIMPDGKVEIVDYIFHLAAGTHVDRSIHDPVLFVHDNVLGTVHLLEFARRYPNVTFLYFSTDEVFGPAQIGSKGFSEWDRYNSKNPYAATKAGAEEIVNAYNNTYGIKTLITHTMNIFGERQSPEKFVPSTIRKVRDGETVIIHADSSCTIPGSRFYIHARNVAAAILFIIEHGKIGEKYNIVGEKEISNLTMAQLISQYMPYSPPLKYKMVDFHSSRPGHDLRYALSGDRLAWMGWKLPVDFEKSLAKTIEWTLNNPQWLSG